MKYKLRSAFSNPILMVLTFVMVMGVGWRHYTYNGLALSLPQLGANILANGNFANLRNGLPIGWPVAANGRLSYRVNISNGYVSGKTLRIRIVQYASGDVTVTSPRVNLRPNQTYLYKGYYKTNTVVALLVRFFYKDGTTKLLYIRDYKDSSGDWSTVSDAFSSGDSIAAVQYVYRAASQGQLEISGTYLESDRQVYPPPQTVANSIPIPNQTLSQSPQVNMPDKWLPYHAGNNKAAYTYGNDTNGPYLQVAMSQYKSGEAKWQYQALPVSAHQYFIFAASYTSTVPAEVIAEYLMHDGTRQFTTLAAIMPAHDWTAVAYPFEIPPGAQTAVVSLVLQQNGVLAARSYAVLDETRPGRGYWARPAVSITFDDGWQSAYSNGSPMLNRNGFKSTYYINASSIETPGFMTAAELQAVGKNGNEIAAHGYAEDDLTSVNTNELSLQMSKGRDYLRQAGFRVTDFATPYGNTDAEVQRTARADFQTSRGTEPGINTFQNFNPYNLKILYVDNATDTRTVAEALQQTRRYNGWLILVYHRIAPDSSKILTQKAEITTVTIQSFTQQLALIKKSGIPVMTVAAAFAALNKE